MEPKTYTESALCDALKKVISSRPDQISIIDRLWTIHNPSFFYDPSQDTELLDEFLTNQGRYKRMLKRAILEIVTTRHKFFDAETELEFINSVKIKFTDSVQVKMGKWGPKYEGVPIATECVIISTGKEQTYTKSAVAKCKGCSREAELEVDPYTHKLQKPPRCFNEDCSYYKRDLQIDLSSFESGEYKLIQIQEPMDESNYGSPIAYAAELKDGDVRETFIGQRKKIIAAFTSIIGEDGVNDILIKIFSINDAKDDYIKKATDAEIATFKEWVKDPTFLQLRLCRSIAPEIFNETLAKMVAAICTTGGTHVDSLSGNIHGLLIGNPSVGKTKILMYIVKMLQKSAYINGATASGAGITIAYDDKIKAPRIGAIPQCSGGIVAFDEIGKIRKEDNKFTLEAMSERTIHYDKGGFDIWANADTVILAGANPKYDYYDFQHTIVENINLIGPLISRFDLIINMVREKDAELTKARMKHIDRFREMGETVFVQKNDLIPSLMLIKYFTYVRTLKPKMTEKASKARHDFFTRIQAIQQAKGSLPIDERFYEGLYRISTAIAKLLLSNEVTEDHMKQAIDLQMEALATFKMNLAEGETNLNMQEEATSHEGALKHCVTEMQSKMQEELISYDDIIAEMISRYPKYWSTEKKADEYFEKAEEMKILLKREGKYYI